MSNNTNFKPYISADAVVRELTPCSIIVGALLAVVFGAANAYLGLRVGMTISASIPAAVIGMGVTRMILKRDSVLESNMVQTIGSAGESLAAGAIFTMPVLFLWAHEGLSETPGILEITIVALLGALLGIFFMVPLRRALIVKEHGTLPYPEGTACAEVLLAGEKGGSEASTVFIGMGIAAALKFIADGLHIVKSTIGVTFTKIHTEISTEIYPALISVGYICGFRISSYLFSGGLLGWIVLIPLIFLFGKDTVMFPATVTISQLWENGGAIAIWSSYIRYIGAGALAAGGIITLIKSLPLIVRTFKDAMKDLKGNDSKGDEKDRTSHDIKMPIVLGSSLIIVILLALLPQVPLNFLGALLVVIFGFFFATVSSRMVGLVGSSNNPVSGMTIATLLIATFCLKATGNTGIAGMTGAITIGAIICLIAAIAGDTSQDLKTGYILGATPRKQQYGEIIGVAVAAVTIGGVMYLLDAAWGFGSKELAAPQAMLMKIIVEGVMSGNIPWALIFIGAGIAILVEIVGLPVLPFAIGLYLPIELTSCIMIGGIVRWALETKKHKDEATKKRVISSGILCSSGMIAGEGLIGILLAVFAIIPIGSKSLGDILNISNLINLGQIGGLAVVILTILTILKFTIWNKKTA